MGGRARSSSPGPAGQAKLRPTCALVRLKARPGWADCPDVVFSLPKITQGSSTKSAPFTYLRGSGLFLFGVLSLNLTVVGCGERGNAGGDGGGGIGNVESQGGSDSDGTRSSAGSEGSTEGDIELPPETGGSGGTEDEACESFELDLKPAPTNLMLVIDRSGSMRSLWGAKDQQVTRWRSLHGVVDQVTGKFDGSVNFGAQIYPGNTDKLGMEGACAVATMPEVEIQSGAREKILATIPNAAEGDVKTDGSGNPLKYDGKITGATPTFAAYSSALEQLKAAEAKLAGSDKDRMPPAMVLITDGGANCSELYFDDPELNKNNRSKADCEPFRNTPELHGVTELEADCISAWYGTYDRRVHTAVENAMTQDSIKTYVIGIGIEDKISSFPKANTHLELNDLATKGGTAREQDTKYFSANNQASLLSALDEIVSSVVSCAVPLGKSIPDDQVPYVELEMKGKKVKPLDNADSCEGLDGWRWTGEAGTHSSLELCGDACKTLKLEGQLDVVVGCEPPA